MFILLYLSSSGQAPYAYLGESFQLRINSDGSFAINKSDLSPSFFDSENNQFLNQGGVWITAEDDAGQIYTAVHHFKGKDSSDFWPGPIDTLTGQTDPVSKWNKVWEMSKETIQEHRSNYNNPNYNLPETLINWPANSENGFANYLAPFADVNKNKKYDPKNGDFPYIKGDKAVYVISNDVASEHTASFGLEMGIELHILAYTLNENPETVFFDCYLISRKNKNYKNVKLGLFIGGECGNPRDNYGATFVSYNSILIYNGDNFDEDNFGTNLPYAYAQFLNQKMSNSLFFSNIKNAYNGLPQTSQDYNNYINAKWLDGSSLTYGDSGKSGEVLYNYMYPGITDPLVQNWSENSLQNEPGRRNGIGVISTRNLSKGDFVHVEFAIGASTTLNNDNIFTEVENKLKRNLNLFQATSSSKTSGFSDPISIYPNPIYDEFTIDFLAPYNLEIINNQGITVFVKKNIEMNKYRCNVHLPSGVYHLKLMTDNRIINQPILVTQ